MNKKNYPCEKVTTTKYELQKYTRPGLHTTGNKNDKKLRTTCPKTAERQMNLLPQIKAGFDAIMADKDIIATHINANMTFFPLCCSTGILNNITTSNPAEHERASFEAGEKITGVDAVEIKKAKYIHQIVKQSQLASRQMYFPIEVARWNALSKILAKVVDGSDDGPSGGYNNYKAAQILMCDRLVADKRDPKFKFDSYNIVFSVDQLMDWLLLRKADSLAVPSLSLGEFYASPPVPGGHGARVRAGTFTPDHAALQAYHDERIERVRDHVLEYIKPRGKLVKAVDKIAGSW